MLHALNTILFVNYTSIKLEKNSHWKKAQTDDKSSYAIFLTCFTIPHLQEKEIAKEVEKFYFLFALITN